ncbi:hypothetical protein DFJ58DRAFT_723499 [Suillus subalutaceus]|uniref:uncharacterized protein n=1 Tax=Suillus subalutaceus TaxID=48586 RepID=UPI001B882F71|nr:uncharacterized protein DFJ58DRAFT_736153 [Suillus subalutaceus]XP_041245058.1 uncharacterized protein DFJ58DRAFT_726791 [Suillus subalutaceus]XP_041248247.1 uncharacterized protein DFJ58DRAFT_723499 [Suillus subalutaceus]KAG1833229.1 hypothetical protein DFJ58DRAFT_736153 [Suillus subalutaceus]KAG1858078.1 hypothetical protein DFJ58DRAFT_726791 [Suillus subalutaceus]KAG1868249.1 hypothetical protein DFJ58DRAFT_723499 [Suillus subalutaceus]
MSKCRSSYASPSQSSQSPYSLCRGQQISDSVTPSDISDDTSDSSEVYNMYIRRYPNEPFDAYMDSMPETSEEASYLLEMARADLEVRRLEKDLAERLLHQFRMRKHHLRLRAKRAKRNFGDAEANVGRTRALVVRCGFVCSERSLWSPRPKSTIKSCKRIRS